MDAWEYLRKGIGEAHLHTLEKMEKGAFKTDLYGYNEATGFIRGLRHVENIIEDFINKSRGENATNEDGA